MKESTLHKLEKATDIASVAIAGAIFAIKLAELIANKDNVLL